MKLDRIIAVRTGKTVYRDGDRVIKVFDSDYSKADILNEALNQARIEETGLAIPKVLEVTMIDGKWAIITEYIEGKTMAELMKENPDKFDEYLDQFVDLQLLVHSKKAPLLNKLKDKMNRKITQTDLDATTRYELHTRLESMPKHDKVCHGDFNPSNIIVTKDGGLYILDWRMPPKATLPPMWRAPICCSAWRATVPRPTSTLICSARRAIPLSSTFKSGFRSLPLPSPLRASPKSVTSCSRG